MKMSQVVQNVKLQEIKIIFIMIYIIKSEIYHEMKIEYYLLTQLL